METTFTPQHEAEADETGKLSLSLNEFRQINMPAEQEMDAANISPSRTEILDFGDQGFLLHEILSAQECKHFINEGERAGFGKIEGSSENYRSSQRITFENEALAGMLWKRLRPWLSNITIDGDHQKQHIHGIQFLLQGTWTPAGLNPMFRLCRYMPGGHFAPHFDGHFVKSSQERSLQTFMLYLNGDFEGGSTNFVDERQRLFMDSEGKYCAEEKNVLCGIEPEPGLAIVFNHHRLHEGQKLVSGVKYILRTDIMFCNVSQKSRSTEEEKALQLVQEAERKEAAGQCLEAADMYRRAFKLSPEVAAAYGN
ncbi:uncharacterized protein LOC143281518 [Babylonia areolata]|uniref:uncharacterized protein LOC143281518 n=1 Tax=Babylonia areolata TaxID=304850 RepID=UPI003FD15A45